MKNKSFLLPSLVLVTLASAQAAITVVNSDGGSFDDSNATSNVFNMENVTTNTTFSFDAGASADKMIVQYSSEGGNNAVITYAGNTLTKIPGTFGGNHNRGIYYLDLAGTGYAGGSANLVIDMTANNVVNGLGYGVVSISGSALGFSVAEVQTSSESVTITPLVADSFVIAGYGSNGGGTVGLPGALTSLYNGAGSNNNAIGSAAGAAGYQTGVAASSQTYTFNDTGEQDPVSSAVAFAPIPEPSSLGLLALGSFALLGRRARHPMG